MSLEEQLKAVIEGTDIEGVGECVANTYYNLSKEELKDLILNYDYVIKTTLAKKEYEKIIKNIAKEHISRNSDDNEYIEKYCSNTDY